MVPCHYGLLLLQTVNLPLRMSTMTGVDCIIFSFNSSHGYSEGRWGRASSKLEVPDRGEGEEAFQRRGLNRKRDYWCIYSMLP